jgi:hypothetical protein
MHLYVPIVIIKPNPFLFANSYAWQCLCLAAGMMMLILELALCATVQRHLQALLAASCSAEFSRRIRGAC